jgi:hypothetical protein
VCEYTDSYMSNNDVGNPDLCGPSTFRIYNFAGIYGRRRDRTRLLAVPAIGPTKAQNILFLWFCALG